MNLGEISKTKSKKLLKLFANKYELSSRLIFFLKQNTVKGMHLRTPLWKIISKSH